MAQPPPATPSAGGAVVAMAERVLMDDSGSDKEATTPQPITPSQTPSTPSRKKNGNVQPLDEDGEKAVERVRANMVRLNAFVSKLPDYIKPIDEQIALLETKKSEVKTREQLPLLHRIITVQRYLYAVKSMLEHRVDEKLLVDRMQQMSEYFQRIPVSEKNDKSLLEAWNAMFDVNSIVPKSLAKDHCDFCKKPLILIRKQAQLQCTFCARMTEHLMPIAHSNTWMKTNSNTQPENKRIKTVQAKLNQYRVGTPPIPPEITLGVRQELRNKSHSGDSIALPTPVEKALVKMHQEKYVPYAAKIANILNGHEVCELTDEQINEIINRLKVVQFVFHYLASTGKLSSKQFHTNHIIHQIAAIKGWNGLAASFPIQRTKRTVREQTIVWKTILHHLRQIDSTHSWP
jgi:hypothetical protein